MIMGPSGAGKSTLLYALSGMDRVSSGRVIYKDQVISSFKEKQMADIRSREFGFVFQQTHLVSNLTLVENVAVAGYLRKDRTPEETRKRSDALLSRMNVGSARDRMPSEVSGGEAQRAAIARAMIHEPGMIFADEPTGALNKRNTGEHGFFIWRMGKSWMNCPCRFFIGQMRGRGKTQRMSGLLLSCGRRADNGVYNIIKS